MGSKGLILPIEQETIPTFTDGKRGRLMLQLSNLTGRSGLSCFAIEQLACKVARIALKTIENVSPDLNSRWVIPTIN
jgi:hypothetical protein